MIFPLGTKVNVVGEPDKKGGAPTIQKGIIDEMIANSAARIVLSGGASIQARYSNGGEIGTFHAGSDTKAVKASESFGDPNPTAQTTSAIPAAPTTDKK